MIVDSHLDYLTVSYASVNKPSELGFLSGGVFGAIENIKPFPHYDSAFKLKCGGTLNLSSDSLQGSRLDLSGEPLQYLRDVGIRDAQILMICGDNELKKRTTRIDYCWTIENAGSVRHCLNHWLAGRAKTTFRNAPLDTGAIDSRKGHTLEFGSKKSEQRVVVYDKGAEMKDLSAALIRVELRTRAPFAGEFYGDCLKNNVPMAARTRLKSLLDFPNLQWWQRATSGEKCELGTVAKSDSKWRRWLGTQVKESIRQHWRENMADDREFISQWLQQIADFCV